MVDVVGSIGSVDSNIFSIVVKFVLWFYIQLPYIDELMYLSSMIQITFFCPRYDHRR